jgi:antitoxin (DNA-binding transcriptional repressor) of toxin-antitoxin stability system
MHRVNLEEAAGRLADLIEKTANGEEVIIIRADGSAFRLVAISQVTTQASAGVKAGVKVGDTKGAIKPSSQSEPPDDDFVVYAPFS